MSVSNNPNHPRQNLAFDSGPQLSNPQGVPVPLESGEAYSSFISQNVFINQFGKVNSPTKSSTYCLLQIAETLLMGDTMRSLGFSCDKTQGWLAQLWEGFRESRRCSRNTFPESYVTEYTSVYEENMLFKPGLIVSCWWQFPSRQSRARRTGAALGTQRRK